jgi:hypothetical protein
VASDHQLGSWQRIHLILQLCVSTARKLLLIAIARHESRRDGVCKASEVTLARETSLSRKWVGLEITEMVRQDIIFADRHNGRAPVIEINWPLVMQLGQSDPTCELTSQLTATCERSSQVELTAPSVTCQAHVTCEVDSPNLRTDDAKPANSDSQTCEVTSHKGSKGLEEGEKKGGSRAALTLRPPVPPKTIPGSTKTAEQIEKDTNFAEAIRPEQFRKKKGAE